MRACERSKSIGIRTNEVRLYGCVSISYVPTIKFTHKHATLRLRISDLLYNGFPITQATKMWHPPLPSVP